MHSAPAPRFIAFFVTLLIPCAMRAEQQFASDCPLAQSVVPDPAVRKMIEKNSHYIFLVPVKTVSKPDELSTTTLMEIKSDVLSS